MKFTELTEVVSKLAKADEKIVRRTLKAAMAVIREEMEKEDKVLVPGLGSFIRKEGKEPGSSRTIFKPAKEKVQDV